MHVIYKICVNQLCMLSVRIRVNGRLLAKFWSQKLYLELGLQGCQPPNATLFKGQL